MSIFFGQKSAILCCIQNDVTKLRAANLGSVSMEFLRKVLKGILKEGTY